MRAVTLDKCFINHNARWELDNYEHRRKNGKNSTRIRNKHSKIVNSAQI